jgi:hypothetical protein
MEVSAEADFQERWRAVPSVMRVGFTSLDTAMVKRR